MTIKLYSKSKHCPADTFVEVDELEAKKLLSSNEWYVKQEKSFIKEPIVLVKKEQRFREVKK